jgi:hypothetical protein
MKKLIDPDLKCLVNKYMEFFSLVYGNINRTLTDKKREEILIKLEEIRQIIIR